MGKPVSNQTNALFDLYCEILEALIKLQAPYEWTHPKVPWCGDVLMETYLDDLEPLALTRRALMELRNLTHQVLSVVQAPTSDALDDLLGNFKSLNFKRQVEQWMKQLEGSFALPDSESFFLFLKQSLQAQRPIDLSVYEDLLIDPRTVWLYLSSGGEGRLSLQDVQGQLQTFSFYPWHAVPFELLTTLKRVYLEGQPATLVFEGSAGTWQWVFGPNHKQYVIVENESATLYSFSMDLSRLVGQVLFDLESNWEDWVEASMRMPLIQVFWRLKNAWVEGINRQKPSNSSRGLPIESFVQRIRLK